MALVSCAANFSEGRRQEIIAALVAAIAGNADVSVLDVHSDADHNRSVITCAGPPPAMAEALFAGIRCAAGRIDMNRHEGQHPRIGAADVVPFTPQQSVSLEACSALARKLGARVGRELQLPVYLYGAASRRQPERRLAELRRGGYEGLRKTIAMEARCPDYGPVRMGHAGAVAIGARGTLIAWNVWLATSEVRVARRIARRIRESGGGLPQVQALGMFVGGRAQVSMNLLDYRRSGLPEVMAALWREAAREDVALEEGELVGLIPQAAVDAAAGYDLLLRRPLDDRILERRLKEAGRLRPTRSTAPPAGARNLPPCCRLAPTRARNPGP